MRLLNMRRISFGRYPSRLRKGGAEVKIEDTLEIIGKFVQQRIDARANGLKTEIARLEASNSDLKRRVAVLEKKLARRDSA